MGSTEPASSSAAPSTPFTRLFGAHRAPGTLLSLLAICILAWMALLRLGDRMTMGGMSDLEMAAVPWSLGDFGLTLAMWMTMMIGMMVPSAAPMILLFQRVVSRHRRAGLRVALFVLAYGVVWSAFSLVATGLQQALTHLAWMTPMSMQAAPQLGAVILILAGLYQWTPAKDRCLAGCHSPIAFLLRYPMATVADSWRLGLVHGAYCLGCCWALMGVLFALGVMNLLAVIGLAIFVLLEKILPGPWLSRLSGLLLVGWGGVVILNGAI